MPIHLLPNELVSQIAAGEVVERPASVVKELIENALDAGATDIRIEVAQGGRKLIRVGDNGAGIPAAEVELAFTRHATSKIATSDDLSHIATLGFRGEALASIAAVAHVTCVTRARGEDVGTQLRVTGDSAYGITERKGIGAPPGTLITVEDLFHSVPARLKFLKAESTERRHIDALVMRYALAYPAVRFRLTHDGRTTFETAGSGKLIDVLIAAYGLQVAQEMLAVEEIPDLQGAFGSRSERPIRSIAVSGYVSSPALSRANRNDLTLFINGRWVQDRNLTYAVVQAYHSMLMVGRYPLCFLRVDVPPEDIDVNVHPAKAEVRFRNPDEVFRTVQRAVRAVLIKHAPVPTIDPKGLGDLSGLKAWPMPEDTSRLERLRGLGAPSAQPTQFGIPTPTGPAQLTSDEERLPFAIGRTPLTPPEERGAGEGDFSFEDSLRSTGLEPSPPITHPQLPALRVLGQIGTMYIVAEGPGGMYLIDQHAAHERVLYEKFMAERQRHGIVVQNLLEPHPVEVPIESAGLLTGHLDVLAGIGLTLEPFGGTTFLLRSVPAILAREDPQSVVNDIVAEIDSGDTPMEADEEVRLIRRVCKRAAIKAGQTLAMAEMQELTRQLEACAAPGTCPHGRPTMIHLSAEQLAREFGRK
jgi:DNA mismatch repair protein MutL